MENDERLELQTKAFIADLLAGCTVFEEMS